MASVDPDVLRVQKMVDLILGKPRYTYPMDVNAEKPKPPFASVKKLTEMNPGIDRSRHEALPDKIITHVEGIRIIQFDVLFTEGAEMQSLFISGFVRQDVLDFMQQEDITVLSHKPIFNETLKLETNWEIRDGLTLTCQVRRRYTHEVGLIEIVEADGVLNEADTNVDIDVIVP